MSRERRRTGPETLQLLVGSTCPRPGCADSLRREEYKGTDAVVCPGCDTPVVRIHGGRR